MKVAIITDQHFGARKGNQNLHKHYQRFYERVFFPTLKRDSVDAVIDMGDTFDARKGIDFWSLNWAKENYYNILRDLEIPVHTIIGNHTAFYKDTNDLNSVELLLREYDNVICYADPTEVKIGSMEALLIPWINNENREKTLEMINATKAKVVFGHLELSGFWPNRNYMMEHGDDPSIFQRFEKVFSGHYHHRGHSDNIHYLGNPYEIYWTDVEDPRGFHIIDTETLELKQINNPHTLFEILYYRDDSPQVFNATPYKDKHVKLIIKEKSSDVKLEQFIDKLYMAGVADLKIMENYSVQESEEFEVEETENTISILNRYVDDCEPDFDMDKVKLKKILTDVYSLSCEFE